MKITRVHIFAFGSVALVATVLASTLLLSDSGSARDKAQAAAKAPSWRPTPKVQLAKGKAEEKRGGVKLAPTRELAAVKASSLPPDARGESSASAHGSHGVGPANRPA